MTYSSRRLLPRLAAAIVGSALGASAWAADTKSGHDAYPAHEIRLIVPWAPGGSTDIVGRKLQRLVADEGYNLVVENLPGASGALGMAKAARAPADGYTLVLGTTSILPLHTQGISDLRPDQFSYIASVSIDPMLLLVPQDGPKTLEAFLDNMKHNPGKVSIGTSGSNNISHLFTIMVSRAAGVPYIHVPYTGGSRVITDLMGHQTSASVLKPSESKAQTDSGMARPLAVFADERLPFMPNVPTFKEKGYNVFPYGQTTQATYLIAPAGLPEPIRRKLVAVFQKAIQSADYQAFARDNGFFVENSTGNALQKEIFDMQAAFDKMGSKIFTTSK